MFFKCKLIPDLFLKKLIFRCQIISVTNCKYSLIDHIFKGFSLDIIFILNKFEMEDLKKYFYSKFI